MANKANLEESLQTFLSATGVVRGEAVKLGRTAKSSMSEPSAEQRARLLADLSEARAGSRMILWLWVALIVAVFLLSAAFAVYQRDDVRTLTVSVLGGTGIMAFLLKQVWSVHTKLVSTQLFLALLPNLPPEQWVKSSVVLLDEVLKAPH